MINFLVLLVVLFIGCGFYGTIKKYDKLSECPLLALVLLLLAIGIVVCCILIITN